MSAILDQRRRPRPPLADRRELRTVQRTVYAGARLLDVTPVTFRALAYGLIGRRP